MACGCKRAAAPVKSASPCDKPLRYHVGKIDPQFKTTADDLLQAVKRSSSLWDGAAKKPLFEQDEKGEWTVNLVYDERQFLSVERDQAAWRQEANEKQFKDVKAEYEGLKANFESRSAAYQRDVAAANAGKPLTREEFDRLNRERDDLQWAAGRLNGLVAQLNSLGWSYNQEATRWSEESEKTFAAAECDRAKKSVNVYQFKNSDDLDLKLAHELGHALGLDHVAAPRAVMYYLVQGQTPKTPVLNDEDVAALRARCQ